MRMLWTLSVLVQLVAAGCFSIATAQKVADRPVEPVCKSVHPFTVQRGTEVTAIVRGKGLRGTNRVYMSGASIGMAVESVEAATPETKSSDLVHLRVKVAADAKPGRYPFRLITPHGISNSLTLHITELPVNLEPSRDHDTANTAEPVSGIPTIIAGLLLRRGEADYYSFQAATGETLTFEAISGLPQIASAGSSATIPNFDPALTIYEAAGSWLDAKRLKRVAYNDEPVWVFGRVTDAHLVHQFKRGGSYLLRVEAFAGQGGPEYSYQLKILRGSVPQDLAVASQDWDERSFTTVLSSDRLNQVATRGGGKQDKASIETYRASSAAASPLLFKLPATIEGTLMSPGETHRARFELNSPKDLAIEIETPGAAPPLFNPVVRLLNSSGEELASNLFVRRDPCSGALSKSLQPKTTIAMKESGVYTLEMRDATADLAGPGFRYRVQIRPQVPHVGKVKIDIDHLNLLPDEAKTIRVLFDREEDYREGIAVEAESLPPGVRAMLGADFEAEKDAPQTTGKRERYLPRAERAVLVLTAAPDAAPTPEPHVTRVVVRPLAYGRVGDIVATKLIPIMVGAKP